MIEFILAIIPLEWLAGLAALVGTLAAVWFSGKRSGKTKGKIDRLEENAKANEVRNEIDNRIAVDRDARDKLRDSWQRGE